MSAALKRLGPRRIPAAGRLTAQVAAPTARLAHAVPSRSTLFASSERDKDAQDLVQLFNSLSTRSTPTSKLTSPAPLSGLFGSPSLPNPESFVPLAQQALVRAQLLVHRIVTAPQNGEGEMRSVVKNLDRLSDVLCGVIDLAELVRNAHPDEAWRNAANDAYEGLCGFMNVLNTHTGLYQVLKSVLQDASLRKSLSEEALAVAQGFLRDFEKSGIHLPDKEREQFVDLSDDILVLGRAFMQGSPASDSTASAPAIARFKRSWFQDPQSSNLLAALSSSPALIPSTSTEVHLDPALATWEFPTILRYSQNEEARKAAYIAMNTSAKSSVEVLEQLLDKRRQLAGLTGYESYSQMSLADKMAKTPGSVERFLEALQSHHHPLAARKLSELQALKGGNTPLEAWDRDFYAERYLRTLSTSMPGSTTPISPFLSVGNVLSGLSRMLSSLYGIRLRAANLEPGEAWDGDVVKLQVVEEDAASSTGETVVGTIYADLFARSGKPPSAAHYTVRCSRRIDDDDEEGDFRFGRLQDGSPVDPSRTPRGTSPLKIEGKQTPGRTGQYQLPIVVLLCDFVRGTAGGPSLLSWSEVETLFHEMGHAIHSMVGRTEFHNVSGTRCATDLVELPSILMEHFVSSPSVLSLVARHHATDLPLPYEALQRHLATSVQALDELDTHNQILLAILDQQYHGAEFSGNSTDEMARLYSQRGLFDSSKTQSGQADFLRKQTWHSQFSHLFGYGATYYSYLLDRVLASRVWGQLFAEEPLSREAGEKYKEKLLRWGGGKEGWTMLGDLLGEELSMKKVGEWGIKRGEGRKV